MKNKNSLSRRCVFNYISQWNLINDTMMIYYNDESLFTYNVTGSSQILPNHINKSTDVISFSFVDSSLFVLYKTSIGYSPNLLSEDMKFLKYNIYSKIVTNLPLPRGLEIVDFNVSPNGKRFGFFVSRVNTKINEARPVWEKIILSDLSPDWKVTIDSVNNNSKTNSFLFSATGSAWINDSAFVYCKASGIKRNVFMCITNKKERKFLFEIQSKMNSSFTVDKRLNYFIKDSQNIYQIRSKRSIPIYTTENIILDRFFIE